MTITGSGFTGITELDFGFQDGSEGGTAGDLVVSGDTQMTCVTPQVPQGGQAFLAALTGGDTKTLLTGSTVTFQ